MLNYLGFGSSPTKAGEQEGSSDISDNPSRTGSRSFMYKLLLLDFILCIAIVIYVPYTEIDWIAYMQEVTGFLEGERDYTKLKGDTGPLVYPAGFVYLYSALYYITNHGRNIFLAQCIFVVLYLGVNFVAMEIFRLAQLPQTLCVLLLLSKRVHSIFMLRCFNDCFAMLFAYLAVYLFMKQQWRLGCVMFSLGVSIKMNVLLMAPGLFVVMIKHFETEEVIGLLSICAGIQVALGFPFLVTYPVQYLTKAFELSRVFTYTWTVNFRFLPEEIFVSKTLGLALLAATLATWLILFLRRWRHRNYLIPQHIAATIFESSFAGIVFARTLHYQFYVWFFHQLPFLLYFSCNHGGGIVQLWKFAVLGAIEYAFNKFPSTELSSGLLVASLVLVQVVILVLEDPAWQRKRKGSMKIAAGLSRRNNNNNNESNNVNNSSNQSTPETTAASRVASSSGGKAKRS